MDDAVGLANQRDRGGQIRCLDSNAAAAGAGVWRVVYCRSFIFPFS
jgi:hypothetical protein